MVMACGGLPPCGVVTRKLTTSVAAFEIAGWTRECVRCGGGSVVGFVEGEGLSAMGRQLRVRAYQHRHIQRDYVRRAMRWRTIEARRRSLYGAGVAMQKYVACAGENKTKAENAADARRYQCHIVNGERAEWQTRMRPRRRAERTAEQATAQTARTGGSEVKLYIRPHGDVAVLLRPFAARVVSACASVFSAARNRPPGTAVSAASCGRSARHVR